MAPWNRVRTTSAELSSKPWDLLTLSLVFCSRKVIPRQELLVPNEPAMAVAAGSPLLLPASWNTSRATLHLLHHPPV